MNDLEWGAVQAGTEIASLLLPCVPAATAFTGMMVLGEAPSLLQLLAMAVMTAGMILPVVFKGSKREASRAGSR